MNALMEKETQRTPAAKSPDQNHLLPVTNVFETRDAYVIEAEMPGVKKEGLEISLEGHTLTLTGRREVSPPQSDAVYVESKQAGFRRSFELDPTIDTARISAHLEQGLLTLTLPKAERVKPRKIPVSA